MKFSSLLGVNWRTTASGLSMIVGALADIVHGFTTDGATISWQVDILAIIAGIGLMNGKDQQVTGGTEFQPSSGKVLIQKAEETIEKTP